MPMLLFSFSSLSTSVSVAITIFPALTVFAFTYNTIENRQSFHMDAFFYRTFLPNQPVIHFLVFLCGSLPGIIHCHGTVHHFVPFPFFIIVNMLRITDRA